MYLPYKSILELNPITLLFQFWVKGLTHWLFSFENIRLEVYVDLLPHSSMDISFVLLYIFFCTSFRVPPIFFVLYWWFYQTRNLCYYRQNIFVTTCPFSRKMSYLYEIFNWNIELINTFRYILLSGLILFYLLSVILTP